jgi:hypothetical protein
VPTGLRVCSRQIGPDGDGPTVTRQQKVRASRVDDLALYVAEQSYGGGVRGCRLEATTRYRMALRGHTNDFSTRSDACADLSDDDLGRAFAYAGNAVESRAAACLAISSSPGRTTRGSPPPGGRDHLTPSRSQSRGAGRTSRQRLDQQGNLVARSPTRQFGQPLRVTFTADQGPQHRTPRYLQQMRGNRIRPLLNAISHQLFEAPTPLEPADTTTIAGGETVGAVT